MTTGYTRQDTSNNIANGNTIDADDLDLEFDAVDAAFNSSTGHSHDGTAANGSPITVVGPAQDIVTTASQMAPKTTNTYDLGSATNQWKDLYVDGVAYVDAIDLNGTTITATAAELNILDGVTSTAAELNILDGVTATAAEINILDGATLTVTELNYVDGVTSAIQTQLDAKQALDAGLTSIAGLTTAADKMIYTTDLDVYAVASLTAAGRALLDDADAAAQLVTLGLTATASELNTLDGITATVSELNILDGVTATTAEINILDGVTATAAELNILDGVTLTVTELNYVGGVTSAIQTQLNTKAPTVSPTFTGTPLAPTAATTTNTTQIATTAFVQQEIAAIPGSGLGVGQTWQDVSGSRIAGTSYQNTTGKPIMAAISADSVALVQVSTDNSTWVTLAALRSTSGNTVGEIAFVIPNNHYYRITTGTISYWAELR